MKRLITKEVYDKLSDDLKKEYKADGDSYVLSLEDYEDPGELRRARDREKLAADAAKAQVKETKEELDRIKSEIEEAKNSGHAKKGDIAALEKSWQDKNLLLAQQKDAVINKKDAYIKKRLLDDVALDLASKLTDSPKILLPHIVKRLAVDFETGDDPITRVLDAEGKPSALSVKELEQEFLANADFSGILRGSKASGGGASGGNSGGGALKKPSDYSEKERIELYKQNPAQFEKLFPANL